MLKNIFKIFLNIHHHTGGLENQWKNRSSKPTIHHHTGGLENYWRSI
ncbi:hypothetical protein [uncultured Gammaproteobacteria bacterium]|nr:hypothetical protein [uncultured Gammaproteobacteria bacterium]CAC9997346.1 hypothetical protein [uncultured Gammaproteobacteria bacterium]VVH60430.1 hypothetical protein BAZOLSSOX_242 [uncultured Gammaproteobacteria bacterium]